MLHCYSVILASLSCFFPILNVWGRQLCWLEKSCVHNTWVGQIKCKPGLWCLHLQAMKNCKKTLHRNSGKPIAHHSLPLHHTLAPLGKQNQRGYSATFHILQTQWHFCSCFFLLVSSSHSLFFHFPMAIFCVVLHNFLSLASSSLRYLQLHAWSWKPPCSFPHLPTPCPSTSPVAPAPASAPTKINFQCILFIIHLFTVSFVCVFLSVLMKALGYRVEMDFSMSFFPIHWSGLPKACSGRFSWTAPWWQWAWLPKMTKQTGRKDTTTLLRYRNNPRKALFFCYFFKEKPESTPHQPMVLHEPMFWFD